MAITFSNTVFPNSNLRPTEGPPSGNSVTLSANPSIAREFVLNGVVNAPGDTVSVLAVLPGIQTTSQPYLATQFDDRGQILLNAQGTSNYILFSNGELPSGQSTVTFGNSTLGDFQVLCFATGTRIMTAAGEVHVQDLRPGMLAAVVDAGGRVSGHRPIRWIGRQTVHCQGGWPAGQHAVRIRAGALADGVPARDLVVSMGHGLALGGHWVRAGAVVNGASILFEPPPADGCMVYWHVELERHAILLAEGAPAESYLEDDNRRAFDNAASWPGADPTRGYAQRACLPLTDPGLPGFAQIQAALLARIDRVTGHSLTEDPALVLAGNELAVAPDASGRASFPAGTWHRGLRLVSRHGIAAQMLPGSTDRRRLGVRLHGMVLRAGDSARHLLPGAPAFDGGMGWHVAEATDGQCWRWTDGDAALPAAVLDGLDPGAPLHIGLQLAPGMRYLECTA